MWAFIWYPGGGLGPILEPKPSISSVAFHGGSSHFYWFRYLPGISYSRYRYFLIGVVVL